MKNYSIFTWNNWDRFYAKDVENYLLSKGYSVKVEEKRKFVSPTEKAENMLHREHAISVQDDDSKKYFIISHIDYSEVEPIVPLLKEEGCLGVLKCQYKKGIYGELESKVSPFSYRVRDSVTYDSLRESLIKTQRTNEKLYFKGNTIYGREPILRLLHEIINEDYSSRGDGTVSMEDYLKSMAKCNAVLSLAGHGNFCHRELEAFGMGVPVVQPRLINSYYNDLIPDYHYVSAVNDFTKPRDVAKSIKEKYTLYRSKPELLVRISQNAKEWFDNNILYPNNMKLMEKILRERFNYEL